MFKKILVPLDGSELAERVIPYVDCLAKSSHAQIVLLTAIHPPFFHTTDARLEHTLHINAAADYLARVGRGLDSAGDVETIVASGDPAEAIAWEAIALDADLIAMSTHGRTGLGRLVHGSVADAVMRHASVPVLLLPSHRFADAAWPSDRPLRVVVPLDGSELSRRVLPPALELMNPAGVEIHLVRVVVPVASTYTEGAILVAYDQSDEIAEAQKDLVRTAEELSGPGRTVKIHSLFGPAAPMVVEIAAHLGADVIAMSTHGHSGVARLVAGSVTTAVIQHSHLPVMVFRTVAKHQELLGEPATVDR